VAGAPKGDARDHAVIVRARERRTQGAFVRRA
jgi:hypothetical protein